MRNAREHGKLDSKRRSINTTVNFVFTVLLAALTGLVGTFIHRSGAAWNIPYGLIIAIAVLALSAFRSRLANGITGLGLHLFISSLVILSLAGYGPGSDVLLLVPNATTASLPWFSNQVSLIWLIASVVVQVIVFFMPSKWFVSTTVAKNS